MTIYTGTSGFSYKEWKGSFYPEKLPAGDMLAYYAQRLPAVEINNTFYRMPKQEILAGWAESVPETFRFVLKASRRITHMQRLKDTDENVAYLVEQASALGDKLGPLLFQLPPFLKADVERLQTFMTSLPTAVHAAMEFRNPSWFCEEVFDTLRAHNVALCLADTGAEDDAPWTVTADWGYLRLRQASYDNDALDSWAERIASAGWRDTFVFFKHEDEGAGPRMATAFGERFT